MRVPTARRVVVVAPRKWVAVLSRPPELVTLTTVAPVMPFGQSSSCLWEPVAPRRLAWGASRPPTLELVVLLMRTPVMPLVWSSIFPWEPGASRRLTVGRLHYWCWSC